MSEVSSQTPCSRVNTNLLVEMMNNAIVHLDSRGTAIRKHCSINNEWHAFQKKIHVVVISSLSHLGNERPLDSNCFQFPQGIQLHFKSQCPEDAFFQYILAGMLLGRKKLVAFLQNIILLNPKYFAPDRLSLTSIQ